MQSFPVDDILPELKAAVLAYPSVILQAPPGSGKTTHIPLKLLEVIAPGERILMLEPRRIAAVSAARWMAKTLGEEIGRTLGYSIRFDSRVSKETRIEVVTEGILTRRLLADPGLEGVAMIIFDEFHERNLQADLALALCLDICHGLREDLKLLIMSATMDCGPIAALLGDAPVITSGGKAFPVETRYREAGRDKALDERIKGAVRMAVQETTGDLLVFLPGAGEIRRAAESLGTIIEGQGISIHPLYGDLPFEEQERAIIPSRQRKIVLATNIAETSLTIEGVEVVIDGGLTRRLQHDPATGMNRLMTVTVSRASAEQRQGRAGRLGPGVCYRLYSRHAFQSMLPFAPPDMLVSDLSSLALDLAVWGVKEPRALAWLDPPPDAAWEAARRLLLDLGVLDQRGSVTPLGKAMAPLPLHPRLSRLLLRSADLGCLNLGADLAAILSERDIIRRSASDAMRHPIGTDISERLDILQQWREKKKPPEGADPWALRAVDRISRQLRSLITEKAGASLHKAHGLIPRLLLCAYPDRVAKRRDDGVGRFLLSRGRGVRVSGEGALGGSPFNIAAHVDAGEHSEGVAYLAEPIDEALIREELKSNIETRRRTEWDKREGRIVSILEERLGAICLSAKPLNPSDDEARALICEAIRSGSVLLNFSTEARQLQGRAALIRRAFPEEHWPDLSSERLLLAPDDWMQTSLRGIRTRDQIARLDILPSLQAQLSWEQRRLLDERAPVSMVVPSGHRVALDYAAGDAPVLAVKLQEMFGLADTPTVAGGRIKVLLHLLSPARRPVQVTQDLKGFWNSGYILVKKDLKGRYPKHPWPDDPWNAVPTRYASHRRGL